MNYFIGFSKFIVITAFFSQFNLSCEAKGVGQTPSFSTFFGTWETFKREGSPSPITDQKSIDAIMNKKIMINRAVFDRCLMPKFYWSKRSEFSGRASWVLLPEDSPDKRHGKLLFLSANCSKGSVSGLEVTNKGELVEYGDGVYYFYRRSK